MQDHGVSEKQKKGAASVCITLLKLTTVHLASGTSETNNRGYLAFQNLLTFRQVSLLTMRILAASPFQRSTNFNSSKSSFGFRKP